LADNEVTTKMRFYIYRPDANSLAGIGFSMADNERIVQVHYTDTPIMFQWTAPIAHGFTEDVETQSDFPSLSNFWRIPVMTEHAWDSLRPLIGYCCEALPIVHPSGEPFFIIDVMDTVDCLDGDRSEVKRFTDGGIMRVVRYSLRKETAQGKHIFKLPGHSGGELIVDEEFRRIVESNGLKGLLFKELPLVPSNDPSAP
jgi:hypothetical protein